MVGMNDGMIAAESGTPDVGEFLVTCDADSICLRLDTASVFVCLSACLIALSCAYVFVDAGQLPHSDTRVDTGTGDNCRKSWMELDIDDKSWTGSCTTVDGGLKRRMRIQGWS